MTKKLIVNADDFGRSPGVSRGILEAHRRGIITSTTVMVNQPGVEEQLAEALACPDLGIGLHLVFTAWRPVLPPASVPGLVQRQGRFIDQHTAWSEAEHVPADQLRAEFAAQFERFIALAGRLPDHLDCHHFVHLYPPFFQEYADLAAQHGLPLRVPFPPETEFGKATKTLSFLRGFPGDLVRGMIVSDSALLRARGLSHPDRFVSSFFGRRAVTVNHLRQLLDSLAPGTSELMCHPGYADDRLASSTYRAERELELSVLTDPVIIQHVADLGIELVTYRAFGT